MMAFCVLQHLGVSWYKARLTWIDLRISWIWMLMLTRSMYHKKSFPFQYLADMLEDNDNLKIPSKVYEYKNLSDSIVIWAHVVVFILTTFQRVMDYRTICNLNFVHIVPFDILDQWKGTSFYYEIKKFRFVFCIAGDNIHTIWATDFFFRDIIICMDEWK